MASICKQVELAAPPEDVWAALRDWGALHERLVPGFAIADRTAEMMELGLQAVKRAFPG
jgi:carbon monoxide dehydrogenase subunit G